MKRFDYIHPPCRFILAMWVSIITMIAMSIWLYDIKFNAFDTSFLLFAIGLSGLTIGLKVGIINTSMKKKK